jgi:peptidase M1-like protein
MHQGIHVLLLIALANLASVPASVASPGAKLAVLSVSQPPKVARPGDRFLVKATVINKGDQGLNAALIATLRRSHPSTSARTIGFAHRFLAARHVTKVLIPVRLPAMQPGPWHLVICAVRSGFAGPRVCAAARRPLVVRPPLSSPAEPAEPADREGQPPEPTPTPPSPPGPPAPSQYTSGARTLNDSVFPEIGNGGYDVQRYDIALNYDPALNTFNNGTKTTIIALATQSLSDFSLDFEGLTVSAVTVDGQPASFAREAPALCSPTNPPSSSCAASKLVVTPATPIDRGETFHVVVSYSGEPQPHMDARGKPDGWIRAYNGTSADGAFVVDEPIGAQTWFPDNNVPSDKATYDFEITVPEDTEPADGTLMGIANGELVSPPTTSGGSTTWHWRESFPLATYLATATVGDFDLSQTMTPSGLQLNNAIDSSYSPETKAAVNTTLAREEEILDFYAPTYTPYPFDSAGGVVDRVTGIGHILEVQTKVLFQTAGGVEPDTLAHEFAHQWWGDSVTPAEWSDVWMNEGWATWSEWSWSYSQNGSSISPAQHFTNNYTPGTKWQTPTATPTAAGILSPFPIYTRPAMMIEALHQILGEAKFTQLTRQWQSAHRYGNGTRAEFIELADEISGFTGADLVRLNDFFQEWLYGTTQPAITGGNFFSP